MRNLLNIFPSARFQQILFVLHKTPHEKTVTTFVFATLISSKFGNVIKTKP
jgi:hypothetical protein